MAAAVLVLCITPVITMAAMVHGAQSVLFGPVIPVHIHQLAQAPLNFLEIT